jgi:hypothetical protein
VSIEDFNTSYVSELARPSKVPVYIVEFENLAERFSTKTVYNPDPAKSVPLTYMMAPNMDNSSVRINEGSASIGNFTFSLLDKYRYITKWLSLNTAGNLKVTVKAGFTSLSERFYVTIFVGRVFSFGLASDNLTWNFTLQSLFQDTQQKIFTSACTLTQDVGLTDTVIYVDDTSAFPVSTGGVLYLRIDDEVMGYTTSSANSFTVVRENQNYSPSGMYTPAATHSAGTQVANFAVLEGNPIDLALQIMTSTGAGTNGPYDVLPYCCGLAIDEACINVATFEDQRDKWLGNSVFRIEGQSPTDGKTFLESEIYNFIGSYPLVDAQGRLSLRVLTPPLPTQNMFAITDDNLEGPPTWQGNFGDKYFFNEILLQYDYDIITDTYKTATWYEDADSQTKYGIVSTLTLNSKAIRSGVLGSSRIYNFMHRLLKRFAIPSPVLSVQLFSTAQVVKAGDLVLLTSSKVPDIQKGVMGVVNQIMEVVEISMDLDKGRVKALLHNTGFSYGRKYFAIGPAGMPHYTGATALQKLYGFLGVKQPDGSALMSDGTDAYYIAP